MKEPMPQNGGEIQSSDEEQVLDVDSEMEALLDDPEPSQPGDVVLTPAHMSVIQETVASLVQKAMHVLQDREAQPRRYDGLHRPSPHISNVATPLGLNRPLDKSLEDRIICGEYVDFTLLLPDSIYQSQSIDPWNLCQALRVPRSPW